MLFLTSCEGHSGERSKVAYLGLDVRIDRLKLCHYSTGFRWPYEALEMKDVEWFR